MLSATWPSADQWRWKAPTRHSDPADAGEESASSVLYPKSRFSGFWSPMESTGVLKSELVGRRVDLLGMTGSVARALELKKNCCRQSSISDINKPSGPVKRFTIF